MDRDRTAITHTTIIQTWMFIIIRRADITTGMMAGIGIMAGICRLAMPFIRKAVSHYNCTPAGPGQKIMPQAVLCILPVADMATSSIDYALSTSMNVSCGMFTLPMDFIRFFPSFCFSSSLRLRGVRPC